MSQTVVPPGPPPVVSSPPPGSTSASAAAAQARRAGTVAALLQVVRRELAGTPGRLRVVSAGAVLAALLGALLGGWALQMRSAALDDASAAAAHLVLLQGVQTRLAQADADATNGYLEFGPESQGKLQEYRRAIAAASSDLAKASRGSDDDEAKVYGAANQALAQYTGLIEAGRVYNAEKNLVGASFVLSATQQMQSRVLDPIQKRTDADTASIDSAYGKAGNARWLLAAGAIIGLGGLLFAQRQVSRQSHRYLNVPMAAGTVLLLVGFGVAGANMAGAQADANDVRDNALASSTELSRARVAAFQAKSIESRTIIQRGSATTKDADWTQKMQQATALRTPEGAVAGLAQYRKQHVAMNTKDAEGDWDGARQLVVASDEKSINASDEKSINAAFDTFADGTETPLTEASTATTDGLADAGGRLLPAGIVLVVLGLLAAGAAWWGVSQRLGEYR